MCKIEAVKQDAKQQVIESMQGGKPCIHVTNKNSKTGPACLCLSLPPQDTCRTDAPCKKECYCMKGTQQFRNVLTAYYRNYFLYKIDGDLFFKQLDNAIKFYGLPLFRFFDAGDMVDAVFFNKCIDLVNNNKKVRFLMYTKKYDIVNNYIKEGGTIPENLVIRFSYWCNGWNVENPYNLPVTYVDFIDKKKNVPTTEKTFLCKCNGVTCSQCKACFNKRIKSVTFNQH